MAKKQIASRIDERIADDLATFCQRGRVVQEGVIEAAIYWLVHRMPREEYLEIMEAAAAYLDNRSAPDAAEDGRPIGPRVQDALARGGRRRPGKRTG